MASGLRFHWYLRTLSLKLQKARSKIEVFLSLPCWLSQSQSFIDGPHGTYFFGLYIAITQKFWYWFPYFRALCRAQHRRQTLAITKVFPRGLSMRCRTDVAVGCGGGGDGGGGGEGRRAGNGVDRSAHWKFFWISVRFLLLLSDDFWNIITALKSHINSWQN